MSTATPTPAQPDPGPGVDWDALDAHVFGDQDPDEAANTEADRQFARWAAASKLASKMKLEGADRASIARALRQAYPDILLPGYDSHYESYSPAEATAEPGAEEHQDYATEPAPAAAPEADEEQERPAVQELGPGLRFVVGLVGFAVAMLAAIGFAVSFDTQVGEVRPYFGEYAPLVPLGIDLGIVVFAALNLVLARLNMSLLWLRVVPWVLTAMSLYINLSAHHELVARVAHVALPGMWIIASEVGTHILRIRAGLEAGTRTESLGLVRWILAPVSTARLWRHMRLWGVKTAAGAREVEAQRLKAKAALRFRFGAFWRFRAPVQLRAAYALRAVTDTEVYEWTAPATADDEPADSTEATTEPSRPEAAKAAVNEPETTLAAPRPVRKTARKAAAQSAPKQAGTRVDDAEAIERLKALAPDEDGHVSIKRARAELHCGSDRAKRLLADAGLLAPETVTD
jgi:hypothetical protein